jgi:hypothetical protein
VKKIYTIEFLLIGWRPWFDHSASSETLLYTTLLLPYSFSLVCRCCAVQTTSSSAVVDRPSPRLALWTTRQEDLDVVDLSRLFVGCLRLHYRLITWCQRFASCFLLFFYKKCQTHKWTDNNWNEWRDDWRKFSLNLTIDTKNLYTNINWFVLNIIM